MPLRAVTDIAPGQRRVFWIGLNSGCTGSAAAGLPSLMSEPSPSRFIASQKRKTLLERLTAFIFREPENREELLEALQEAHSRNLLDADALSMIEGVLQVSELRARDLMVPRTQADMIDVGEPVD